jgi:hypothetical protein
VVALWLEQNGHHPAIAYQTAFTVNLVLQVSALSWFLLPHQGSRAPVFLAHAIHRRPAPQTDCLAAAGGYERAIQMWMERVNAARHQVVAWRAAAVASAVLTLALSGSFAQALATQRMVTVHFVQLRDSFETGLLLEMEANPYPSGDGASLAVIARRKVP